MLKFLNSPCVAKGQSKIIMSMSDFSDGSQTYTLATGYAAEERLTLQDTIASKTSRQHLLEAKLSKGKIVCDLGCGNGRMTEFLATTVGDTGHVYAIDVSKAQLAIAEKYIQSKQLNNVTFVLSDINQSSSLLTGIADIIYSRFLLMHLPDPALAIQNMKKMLKQGGIIASQESILSTCFSTYRPEIFTHYTQAMIALGKYYGVNYDIGNNTKNLFEQSGFKVKVFYNQITLSAQDAQKLFLLGISERKEIILKAKIASEEIIGNWEAAAKSIPIHDGSFSYGLAKQAYIIATL